MNVTETAAFLREMDDVFILTHRRPDGDTIGCAAALCAALRGLGKRAWVFPNVDTTSLFTPYLEGYLAPAEGTPGAVVSVDIADRGLFPVGGEHWLERGVDLCIDHHPSNEGFARENCIDAARAACGEIIYDIVKELGPVTAEIALPLYLAISTDTGCFQYSNTTPDTHRIAAALMETGIDHVALNKRHFRTKTFKRLKLESLIVEGMQLFEDGKIAIVSIPLSMLSALGADEGDLEDISAFAGQIEGVETAVTIKEKKEGGCKLSVRTSGGLNATKVCALLGGGGHAAAAGCAVSGTLEEAVQAILGAIRTVGHG